VLWDEERKIGEGSERNPGENVAVEFGAMKHAFTPGADVKAAFYRSTFIMMMTKIAPERFSQDAQPTDAVFRAAAKVPAEWMGAGIVRNGSPFDVDEFLRLCGVEMC
jgi:hypothetical protein